MEERIRNVEQAVVEIKTDQRHIKDTQDKILNNHLSHIQDDLSDISKMVATHSANIQWLTDNWWKIVVALGITLIGTVAGIVLQLALHY